MNAATEAGKAGELTLSQGIVGQMKSYLGGRRGLIVLAVIVAGAGLFLNWGWLAAAGIAPFLVALAPCAAMCALGLCMNKAGGKSCSTDAKSDSSTTTAAAKQDGDEKP